MPCSNNSINFNTFGTDFNWKLTTQTKQEHKKKEVETLISLKLAFALLLLNNNV